METVEFKTSGGYIATLKSRLTFGDYRKIKDAAKKAFKFSIDPKTNLQSVKATDIKFSEMDLSALSAANEAGLSLLIIKITDANGIDLGSPLEALDNLPPTDGKEIYDEVDRLTKASEIEEKKGV
jgi:hypothetical protein